MAWIRRSVDSPISKESYCERSEIEMKNVKISDTPIIREVIKEQVSHARKVLN